MNLLLYFSLVCSAAGFNLEFNSQQFPSWITTPMTYSSFYKNKLDLDHKSEDDANTPSCIFLLPKRDTTSNGSNPYIFESKCYSNSQCGKESKSKDSVSILSDEYMCRNINGTIDKVVIFSVAEYNFEAVEISYAVYIIIEGCFFEDLPTSNYIRWILTNDTINNPKILKHYELNLPLNDNHFYLGEMTFDGGDRGCSSLCTPTICDKSFDLKIGRGYDHVENSTTTYEPSTPNSEENGVETVPKIDDDETISMGTFSVNIPDKVKEASSTGMLMYVGIVVVVVLVIAFLSYLVYHTLY